MSYDVYFECDAEDQRIPFADDRNNYTSNVSPMWGAALGINLGDLIGQYRDREAADLLKSIELGIGVMKSDPERFRAMNPGNGWGDYEGALAYLEWIAAACRYYPHRKVRVSR